MLRRAALLAALLAAAVVLAGCGNKQELVVAGETEGIYVDVGGLKYQVQLSRVLNPALTEDKSYFTGLLPGSEPTRDETWFGIFMRVQNTSKEPRVSADTFEIVDTEEQRFDPVLIDGDANVFAYEPRTLEPGGLLPAPDSAAYDGPTRGALLLFKLETTSLQNRPLELVIRSEATSDEAVVDLDV